MPYDKYKTVPPVIPVPPEASEAPEYLCVDVRMPDGTIRKFQAYIHHDTVAITRPGVPTEYSMGVGNWVPCEHPTYDFEEVYGDPRWVAVEKRQRY